MIKTGDLNRRLIVRTFTSVQDEGGGFIKVDTGSYTISANIENRSTSVAVNQYGKELFPYDYKITVRFEASRLIGTNCYLEYDNKLLNITGRKVDNEGRKLFVTIYAIGIDDTLQTITEGDYTPYGVKEWVYVMEDTADGVIDTDLIGKDIFNMRVDGIGHRIILNGSPVGQQVLFNKSTGALTFAIEVQQDVTIMANYL